MKKCYSKKKTKRNRCHSAYSISFQNSLHFFLFFTCSYVSCARYCPDNENRTKIVNEVFAHSDCLSDFFSSLPSLVRNSRITASFCHLATTTTTTTKNATGEYLETDEEAACVFYTFCVEKKEKNLK